jgi:DnaK suppressor protein
MTKTEAGTFKAMLENTQTELSNRHDHREVLAVETSPDDLDRIQHASERDYAVGWLERTARKLHEVRAALLRIDSGTFGLCMGCEENISAKRLAAVPWASSCIVCQEAEDRGQQAFASEAETPFGLAA